MYKLAEFNLIFSVFVVGKLSTVFVTNCCHVIQYVGKINQQGALYSVLFLVVPKCFAQNGHRQRSQRNCQGLGSYWKFLPSCFFCRSQWPRGLRRRSATARLLRSWDRIPRGSWMSVCCECCVLSGRGLCDELITRPEESYRLWCVTVCVIQKPHL